MLFPVSLNQERRLYAEEVAELCKQNYVPHNLLATFKIDGYLDISALEKTLNMIIMRHSGLRTAFFRQIKGINKEYMEALREFLLSGKYPTNLYAQRIVENTHINLNIISGTDQQKYEERIREIVESAIAQPFNYANPPFMRAYLCESTSAPLLIMVLHHHIFDMWSISLLHNEISVIYNALCTGKNIEYPIINKGYTDYALLQRRQEKISGYKNN